MRQAGLMSQVPLTRHSVLEEQGWVDLDVRAALAHTSLDLPSLHLQFLGSFRLAYGNAPLTGIDMPRLQSLLAYLTLHHGVPLSRRRLAALLWSDSTEAQAHTNLRNLLCKLRQALPQAEQWLVVDRRSTLLWQDGGSWTLDVLDFERAVARAEQAVREGDDTDLRLALVRAVELYRGELLPGCYDEWVLPECERLSQVFLVSWNGCCACGSGKATFVRHKRRRNTPIAPTSRGPVTPGPASQPSSQNVPVP